MSDAPVRSGRVLLVVNPRSGQARDLLLRAAEALGRKGLVPLVTDEDADALGESGSVPLPPNVEVVPVDGSAAGSEVVVVLGGDGTVLRAAEWARGSMTPLLGVNLGHVGFLAEAEPEEITAVVAAIAERRWVVEERLALDVRVIRDGATFHETWALNEIAIEKQNRERMIDLVVEIDGRPLSQWGCDGVVCATPTGSTAYAFSAGGPVVWPEVSALLVVPLSAHALFARPIVVSPTSTVAFELGDRDDAQLAADGRRSVDLDRGCRVEVRQSAERVRFARLNPAPFTDRLVARFALPVEGWRGRRVEEG